MNNYAKTLLISLVFFQILVSHYSSALSDTITVNQTLRDDGSIMVSREGMFSLGFFSPGQSTSRYLGIWFNFSGDAVVWVANRDSPINDNSGVLTLGQNLVLSDSKSVSVWSTKVSGASLIPGKVSARIMDSGNFILLLEDQVVWQSFDYPTHVLLSGSKVGMDLRTGLDRVVTAWKSADDPGTGNTFLRIDPAGSPQLILYKNGTKWWRSGHWNGLQWSGLPALVMLPRNNLYNISFIDNEDEITVEWYAVDRSIVTYVMVDWAGSIRQHLWQTHAKKWIDIYTSPGDNCDDYARCGPNGRCDPFNVTGQECGCLPGYEPVAPHDWILREGSAGCKRPERAQGMCGAHEGFVKVENVKPPDAAGAVVVRKSFFGVGGIKQCREECLKNCTCMGYGVADVTNGGSGCMMWHGQIMDVKQFLAGGQDLFVRVDKVVLANYVKEESKGFSWRWIVAVVAAALTVCLIGIGSVLFCLLNRRKKKGIVLGQPSIMMRHGVSVSSAGFEESPSSNSREKTDICFFDLSTVIAATDSFSLSNKLGQGGFGSVYKGVLDNGQELAVKRLSQFSGQGIEEFKNEVVLIAKLQHRNLVKLLGCCINNEEKMLIYEYMPNKSLDLILFDKNKKLFLDWRRRSHIILGIARGLLYLHQDSRLKIIHRDLKASNVLLDASMNPKISDFGMARMFGDDQLEANTNKVVGTYGYMSPEYAMEGLYSTKSDVFSFGVLMLEIITGKKNSNFNEISSLNLVGQVWDLWTEKIALEIVDDSLSQSDQANNQILRWIQIGLLCVQELAADRPAMLEVIFMLGNESLLPSPKRPAFIYKNSSSDTTTSKGGVSVNNITVTVMEPR